MNDGTTLNLFDSLAVLNVAGTIESAAANLLHTLFFLCPFYSFFLPFSPLRADDPAGKGLRSAPPCAHRTGMLLRARVLRGARGDE